MPAKQFLIHTSSGHAVPVRIKANPKQLEQEYFNLDFTKANNETHPLDANTHDTPKANNHGKH